MPVDCESLQLDYAPNNTACPALCNPTICCQPPVQTCSASLCIGQFTLGTCTRTCSASECCIYSGFTPGVTIITGNLVLGATSVTTLTGNIEVTGCVTLGGTLDLSLMDDLQDGQTIVITSQSNCVSGEFVDVVLPDLETSTCSDLDATQVYNGGTLTVIITSIESYCSTSSFLALFAKN